MCDALVSVFNSTAVLSNSLMDTYVRSFFSVYSPAKVNTQETRNQCSEAMKYLSSKAADGSLKGASKITSQFLLQSASKFINVGTQGYSRPNRLAALIYESVTQIASGISINMVEGQDPVDLVSDNIRIRAIKSPLNSISSLSPPQSEAEKAYGIHQRLAVLLDGDLQALDNGNGYLDMSLTQWDSNPFSGGEELQAPQLTIQTSNHKKKTQSLALASSSNSYYLTFQFDTLLNVSSVHYSRQYKNFTSPNCTEYNPDSQSYDICSGCSLLSYTDKNVTFKCFNYGNLLDLSSSYEQSLTGGDDTEDDASDDGAFGKQTSITSINYGALLSTFTSVLSGNPFAIDFQKAKGIIIFVCTLAFVIMLGFVYFRRVDFMNNHLSVYGQMNDESHISDNMKKVIYIKSSRNYKGSYDSSVNADSYRDINMLYDTEDGLIGEELGTLNDTPAYINQLVQEDFIDEVFPTEGYLSDSKVSMNESLGQIKLQKRKRKKATSKVRGWMEFWIDNLSCIFVDTLFFSTFFPDIGQCETYISESTCTTPLNSALNTPLCIWQKDLHVSNGGICSLAPPPPDMTFTLILAVLTVIVSIPITLFLRNFLHFAFLRPELSLWGWDEDTWLGNPPNRADSTTSSDISSLQEVHDKDRSLSDLYYTVGSSEEEAWQLLVDSKQYLDDNLNVGNIPWDDVSRINMMQKVTIIKDFVGIHPNGSPVPLQIYDKIMYRNYKRKLISKIEESRSNAAQLSRALHRFAVDQINEKDVALTRQFVLEQFSNIKRHVLEMEISSLDGKSVRFVRPSIWIASYAVVILSILFFLYWTLNWGVKNTGTTINAWAINFIIGFVQSLVWLNLVQIFINYLVLTKAVKPQLKVIKRVLHQTAINYIQDKLSQSVTDLQVIPHLSASCRIARSAIGANLFGARVIKHLNDNDIAMCRTEVIDRTPLIAVMLVMIPVVVGVIAPLLADASSETFLMTFLNLIILAHYQLYLFSIFALVCPYAALITIILLRMFYFPSKSKITQDKSDKSDDKRESRYHQMFPSWKRSARNLSSNKPVDVYINGWRVLQAVSSCIGTVSYNSLYILVRPDTILINFMQRFRSLKVQKQRQWKIMNIPQKFHGIKSERGDIDKRGVDDLHHHHHHHDTVQFPKLIQEISTAQDLKTSWETINGPKAGYISTIMKKAILNEAKIPVRPIVMSVEEDRPIFHQLRSVANPSETYNLLSRTFRDKVRSKSAVPTNSLRRR